MRLLQRLWNAVIRRIDNAVELEWARREDIERGLAIRAACRPSQEDVERWRAEDFERWRAAYCPKPLDEELDEVSAPTRFAMGSLGRYPVDASSPAPLPRARAFTTPKDEPR